MRPPFGIAAVVLIALPALAIAAGDTEAATTDASSGAALFQERCGGCHLESGFGTRVLSRRVPEGQAALEHRTGLTPEYVRVAVRRGIGSMPQIRQAELPDEELARIAAYLGASK
jgi:mono/diheme cytochrome c family protein